MPVELPELSTEAAVDALLAGEVIAWPTEAVWGLGCDPWSRRAVEKLLALKNRNVEQGLIVIGADFEQFQDLVAPVSVCQMGRALGSWPGPVSWLFPAREDTPRWLTGRHSTLAIRVTDHPLSRRLCRLFSAPLVSTSANPAGQPPAMTVAGLQEYFAGTELAGYVAGELGGRDTVSQIRDLATDKVLRG